MIEISIGGEHRYGRDVTPAWLRSGIDKLRQSGSPVCVKIRIQSGTIDMILATEECPSSVDEGRPFRPEERKIFELWQRKNLTENQFSVNDLAEFIAAVRHL